MAGDDGWDYDSTDHESSSSEDHEDHSTQINQLQNLQDQLSKVNGEAYAEVQKVKRKYSELKKYVIAKRNKIISTIQYFWVTVFLSHPDFGEWLTEDDKEVLKYLESLSVEVQEEEFIQLGYCITFIFGPNPFFTNMKLLKTIKFLDNGTMQAFGTTIMWKDRDPGVGSSRNANIGRPRPNDKYYNSFLSWIGTEEELVKVDVVGKCIKEDLWPDPTKYLKAEEGGSGVNDNSIVWSLLKGLSKFLQ